MSEGGPGAAPVSPTKIIAFDETACRWCGVENHGPLCPMVKAFELDAAGNITRVEFLTAADFPRSENEQEASTPPYPTKRKL